jgi:hypothetical protein
MLGTSTLSLIYLAAMLKSSFIPLTAVRKRDETSMRTRGHCHLPLEYQQGQIQQSSAPHTMESTEFARERTEGR